MPGRTLRMGGGAFYSREKQEQGVKECFLEMQRVKSVHSYPSFLSPLSPRSPRASEARSGRFQGSLSSLLCLTPPYPDACCDRDHSVSGVRPTSFHTRKAFPLLRGSSFRVPGSPMPPTDQRAFWSQMTLPTSERGNASPIAAAWRFLTRKKGPDASSLTQMFLLPSQPNIDIITLFPEHCRPLLWLGRLSL